MALEKELLVAYQMEERFWKEKSRVKWLKWGDNNTRFSMPSFKPGTAKIKFGGCMLRMVKGILVQKRLRSFSSAENAANGLFTSCSPHDPTVCFDEVRNKVSNTMNHWLTRPVSSQEVKRAAFSINADGAPSDDGFAEFFFSILLGHY